MIDSKDINKYNWCCLFTNLTEVDHEYEFKSETVGDYGVVNGTMTSVWLECSYCGHTKKAEYSDYPGYEDDY